MSFIQNKSILNFDFKGIINIYNKELSNNNYKLFDDNYTFKLGNIYDLYNTILIINVMNTNHISNNDNNIINKNNNILNNDNHIINKNNNIKNNNKDLLNNNYNINNTGVKLIGIDYDRKITNIYYNNKNNDEKKNIYITNHINNVYNYDGISKYNYAQESSLWNVYVDGNINYYKLLKNNFSIYN